MKKSYLFVLVVVFISLSSETWGDLIFKNLKGKVKSINEVIYEVDFMEQNGVLVPVEGDSTFSRYYEFDKQGQITAERSYFGIVKCIYDKQGHRLAEYTNAGDGYYKSVGYATGKNGKYAIDTTFNAEGVIEGIAAYEYDKEGRKAATQYKAFDNSYTFRTSYTYDRNGNMIETISRYVPDPVTSRTVIKYNSSGCRTMLREYVRMDSLHHTIVYTCDSMKNYSSSYNYDANAEEVEGWRNTSQFKYDSRGNWVWLLSKRGTDDGIYQISKRTIEYYE